MLDRSDLRFRTAGHKSCRSGIRSGAGRQLIECAIRGELGMEAHRESFEKVFQDHLSEVQRLIALHTNDPEDKLDLTQEVFIRAYGAFSQFRGDSSIGTWLYRIAINVCANAARTRSVRGEQTSSEIEPDEYEYPQGLRDIVDDLAKAEEQRMLKQALRSVSAEQLVVLSLRFSDQLTLPEIAEVVGAPVETVKSRLKTALDKIHSTLAYLNMGIVKAEHVPVFKESTDLSLEVPADGERGARIYHNLGSLYLKKGLIEAALKEWRKAQKVDPTFIDAYLASAQQYVGMNDPSRAVDTLETAVGKVHNGGLHATLAGLYLDLGDLDEGMTHSMRAIDLEPRNPDAHYVAGRAFYRQAEIQEALRALSAGSRISPEHIVEVSWRKAADHYKEAIQLKPEFAKARAYLAQTYLRTDKMEEALAESETAMMYGENDELVSYRVGWVNFKGGKLQLAERHLRRSVSIKATSDKLAILGMVYHAQDRHEEAFLTFNEALSLASEKKTRALLYSNLAATSLRLGHSADAVESAQTALELDPDHVHARCNLSEAYLANGDDPSMVVRLCREGLQMAPNHVCFHRLLAEALYLMDELDDALPEATTAIELEPEKVERWLIRARIFIKLGRIDEAKRDLNTAAELDPENEEAKKALVEVEDAASESTKA